MEALGERENEFSRALLQWWNKVSESFAAFFPQDRTVDGEWKLGTVLFVMIEK